MSNNNINNNKMYNTSDEIVEFIRHAFTKREFKFKQNIALHEFQNIVHLKDIYINEMFNRIEVLFSRNFYGKNEKNVITLENTMYPKNTWNYIKKELITKYPRLKKILKKMGMNDKIEYRTEQLSVEIEYLRVLPELNLLKSHHSNYIELISPISHVVKNPDGGVDTTVEH